MIPDTYLGIEVGRHNMIVLLLVGLYLPYLGHSNDQDQRKIGIYLGHLRIC